jgi:hypothetical protein
VEKARRARRARAIAALGAGTVLGADRLRAARRAQQRADRLRAKNRRFRVQDETAEFNLYRAVTAVVLHHARKALSKATGPS